MRYANLSDTGKVREINQDAVFAASNGQAGLFAVADGMGGHSKGEQASRHLVRKIEQWWCRFQPEAYGYDFKNMMQGLQQAAAEANQEIYHQYNSQDICGTTLVLLWIWNNAYGLLHAGDSRAYLYAQHRFRLLTIDEVWENQPGLTRLNRELGWEQNHGKLYNAVGIRKQLQCQVQAGECSPGMVFLLCSDGLYRFCPQRYLKKYMKNLARTHNPQRCAASLFDKVYGGEAKDNISIILVEI